MTDTDAFRAVDEWLNRCRRPLLVTHQRPDGDALGALAAVAGELRRRGQTPVVALFDPVPPRYALLASLAPWQDWAQVAPTAGACDALVIVDTCARAQLAPLADLLADAPRTLVIDHHATGDALAERPVDLKLCDPQAGAACLLVAEWLLACGGVRDADVATALFTGLATDTGWFRFPSTTARELRAAAALVEAGAAPHTIHRAVFEQDPPGRLRLVARVLSSLELLADGRLAVLGLRQADFAAAGADLTMTEDLVNEVGRLAGLEVTVLLIEQDDGRVRVNLRSKQDVDVAALAQRFSGGGHARAAGARVAGEFDRVRADVVAAVLAALGAGSGHG
jgi:phosphoesterase RecJ-like protein